MRIKSKTDKILKLQAKKGHIIKDRKSIKNRKTIKDSKCCLFCLFMLFYCIFYFSKKRFI